MKTNQSNRVRQAVRDINQALRTYGSVYAQVPGLASNPKIFSVKAHGESVRAKDVWGNEFDDAIRFFDGDGETIAMI